MKNPLLRAGPVLRNALRPLKHDPPNGPLDHSSYRGFRSPLHNLHLQVQRTSLLYVLQLVRGRGVEPLSLDS